MKVPAARYRELSTRIFLEFNDVADYFWKSPRLLEHETNVEAQKIQEYFSDDPRRANLRWHMEYGKIRTVFPYLIALGNMFSVMSVFESYLLIVSFNLEKDTGVKVNSISGRGIGRLFTYLRTVNIEVENIDLFHQIDAAIKIRNCLLHASGILTWSKEGKEIRRIQRSGTYLSKEHRLRRKKMGGKYDELRIVESGFGDRIEIENEYVFVLTSYMRDYLVHLCQSASLLLESGKTLEYELEE